MHAALKLAAALACLAATAAAQEPVVSGGLALEHLVRPDGDGEPSRTSLEAYVEAGIGGVYGGVWGRSADNSDYDEVDLFVGYRNELRGGLSYDLAYYRYIFPTDRASDYGELTFGVAQTLGETASASLDLAWDPENELGNAYIGIEVYPTDRWTLSANYGSYQVADAGSEQEWDVGVTYNVTDETALDLRWYDGTDYVTGYVGLRLTFDTTLTGG